MGMYVSRNETDMNKLSFEITLELHISKYIAVAFSPDFNDADLDIEIEDTLEEHYDNFINNLYRKIEDLGFEHIEPIVKSNCATSKSRYFVFCRKHDYDALTVELIIHLRISDHRLTKRIRNNKTWDRHKATTTYHSQELNEYRCLNAVNPEDMDIYEMSIIVNNNKFKTYRDAYRYIINKIRGIGL